MIKKCFKCEKTKPINEFYKHPQMGDGHLNKCKECTKKDATGVRNANLEYYQAYDRNRASLPKRIKKRKEVAERWRKDPKLRMITNARKKEWVKNNSVKRGAHLLVQNAVKRGDIKKLPCIICGNKRSDAHHEDYHYPLNVVWLCKKHHMARHREINEERRKLLK